MMLIGYSIILRTWGAFIVFGWWTIGIRVYWVLWNGAGCACFSTRWRLFSMLLDMVVDGRSRSYSECGIIVAAAVGPADLLVQCEWRILVSPVGPRIFSSSSSYVHNEQRLLRVFLAFLGVHFGSDGDNSGDCTRTQLIKLQLCFCCNLLLRMVIICCGLYFEGTERTIERNICCCL